MSYIDALEKVFESFKTLTSTKTVVGEPIKVENKTIVPLIQAYIGFGGGGGEGELKDLVKKTKSGSEGNFSGFGGGIKVSPVALLIIDGENVSFIKVDKSGGVLEKVVDKIPDVLDRFVPQKESGE